MSQVKCVARHAVDLPDGRLVPPGHTANDVDLAHPEIRAHIATGSLLPLDTDRVPDRVDDILTWVGNDPDRAQLALNAEQARPEPRKTLVQKLHTLIGGDPS